MLVFFLGLAIERLTAGLGYFVPALEPGGGPQDELSAYGFGGQIALFALYAPLVETLLLQILPMGLLSSIFRIDARISILISAAAFSLLHVPYGMGYVFESFLMGLIFGVAYASYMPGTIKPATLVFVAHAMNNAFWIAVLRLP